MALYDFYKIVGEVTIPEEKKEELNGHVLVLLDRCGLRKIKKARIGDLDTEVAERVKKNKSGKVLFDYSIYEKSVRSVSSYDTKTCTLDINDQSYSEMGISIVLVMALLESYSITPCYVARDNKVIEINVYAKMVEDLIGVRLRFPHRADIWTMYVFCKECEEVEKTVGLDLADLVPRDFESISYAQVYNVHLVDNGDTFAEEVKEVPFDRKQIENAKFLDRYGFLYSAFLALDRDKTDPCEFLKMLIPMPLEERMKLAEEQTSYGIIAELSKYMAPQALVKCYSYIKGTDFWSEWNRLAANGFYMDFIDIKLDPDEKKRNAFHFYKAIQREDDDEALGEFGDRKLAISNEMWKQIEKWKEEASEECPDDFNSLDELKRVMEEIKDDVCVRKMDAALLKELKEKPDVKSTKKALFLLKTMLDDGIELFPELTESQAKKWFLKRCRSGFDKQKINGLLGLLANKDKRMELLGF